jgi:hypothetical protein
MSFATLGSVPLRVTTFRRVQDERGGGMHRTLSGQLRGRAAWSARGWELVAYAMTDAEADAIRAAAVPDVPTLFAGDVLPAAVSVSATVTGDEYERHRDTWHRRLTITLREVSP